MKLEASVFESKLRQELARNGFDLMNSSFSRTDHRLVIQANTLYPAVENKGKQLYVLVPVTLQIELDEEDAIQSIDATPVPSETAADANRFVQTLIDNNQLDGLSGSSFPDASHYIEINENGQCIVKRRRFRSYI